MMVAVVQAESHVPEQVDPPSAVVERLEAFAAEVLAEAMSRPVQLVNGGLYLRGLIEQGVRKSLEPLVERLGEDADYQSLQQFLADSPWDPALVVKAVAERVAPEIDVEAWVLDDTGFPKDGKNSPGVKRQYSGTLGKIGKCQIGVSLHAVGSKGTVPLGWDLYLPEDWCEDNARRKQAKIPEEVGFETKPQLGVGLAVRATGWEIARAPCWAIGHTGITPSYATDCTTADFPTCCRSRPRRPCSRKRRSSQRPSRAPGRAGATAICDPTATLSRSAS
jgi:hypothetical protein